VAAEIERMKVVLAKLGAPPVRTALRLEAIAAQLSAEGASVADVQSSADEIKRLLMELPTDDGTPQKKEKKSIAAVPPGGDPPKPMREILFRRAQELAKVTKPQQMKHASEVAVSLREVVDRELAEALLALTYALGLGAPDGPALMGGNVSLRHDFGFGLHDP